MSITLTWGNPYTHEEHTRTCYSAKDLMYGYGICEWCGQIRHRLYTYDGSNKLVCHLECYKSLYS